MEYITIIKKFVEVGNQSQEITSFLEFFISSIAEYTKLHTTVLPTSIIYGTTFRCLRVDGTKTGK